MISNNDLLCSDVARLFFLSLGSEIARPRHFDNVNAINIIFNNDLLSTDVARLYFNS